MAPPPEILKLGNTRVRGLINSEEICTRAACSKKSKTLNQQIKIQETNKLIKQSNKVSSSVSKKTESSSGKLISNLYPKQTGGGVISSTDNTVPKQTKLSENKITDSAKTILSTITKKQTKYLIGLSKSRIRKPEIISNTTKILNSKPHSETSINKMSDANMTETSKKVKRKKMSNAAIANKKRRNLVSAVNAAIKSQKIFLINSSNPRAFPSLRSALKARGWLEKSACEVLVPGVHSKTSEITMRLLKDIPAYFHWSTAPVDFSQVKNFVTINKFPKNIHFTSKTGLCTFLQEFYWFHDSDIADTIIPRTYIIANQRDVLHFTQHYILCACISMLKFVVDIISKGESYELFKDGQVPAKAIDFAILHCDAYIRFKEHGDIDTINDTVAFMRDSTEFLSWYYEITQENASFISMSFPVIQATYSMCKHTLQQIQPYWDLINLEGTRNLWIIKPANSNCGKGVYLKKSLQEIIDHVQPRMDSQHGYGHFVVQKYIERPLLIYNTKFDIRQWFLVTSAFPLNIWIYSECYLRFSSQQFSLENLHESVHLTNNSVQCNYINGERDQELPEENMWHCDTFKKWLNAKGLVDKWDSNIFPGICKGIIGAVLASQNEMLDRTKSYELYGADFLIGEDFTTILIEINSGPCMRYTTSVTETMVKNCFEDLVKVVVDRRTDPNADTGKFINFYKQDMGPRFNSCGLDLSVVGNRIKPACKPRLKIL